MLLLLLLLFRYCYVSVTVTVAVVVAVIVLVLVIVSLFSLLLLFIVTKPFSYVSGGIYLLFVFPIAEQITSCSSSVSLFPQFNS